MEVWEMPNLKSNENTKNSFLNQSNISINKKQMILSKKQLTAPLLKKNNNLFL